MSCKLRHILALALVGAACAPLAQATTENVGYVSFDLTTAPSTYEFDIVGQSGVNNSNSTAFPVVTTVDLTGLSLVLSFASGPNEVFGSTYFSAAGDGESFNGSAANFGSNEPTKAVLTGTFSTTSFLLFNGTTVTVNPTFTATITDPGGALTDGDFALISATTKPTGPSVTPEPGTWLMVGSGMGLVLFSLYRRRNLALPVGLGFRNASACGLTLALAAAVLGAPAAHAGTAPDLVKLNTLTAPTSGLAGTTLVNVTGSGFPAGPISPSAITLSFSKTCGGAVVTTTTPNTESALLGNTDRVQFLVPAVLKTGAYYVSIAGTSAGSVPFVSSNCSALQVTNTTVTLASCVPTSSIAVTVGTNVDAYVPFGYWEGGSSGIEEVALEGSDPAQHFSTSGVVNSCASNSVTKEVVCTENTANVDLINGSTLTTLTSSSDQFARFTGGSCNNCGVAINSSTNTAVIGMGLSGGGGSGVQYVDLAANTVSTAFPLQHYVSEDISIDSGRNLILSPGEDGVYDLLQVGASNALTEYGNYIGGTLDSAAEDCTTGIALSADEFTDDIYITDLTQAKFTAGSPGTWTAPGQFIVLNGFGFSAGSSGISSAPGTTHLAVVTGEFGGSAYASLLLPSTSGSGTPTLADYAYVSSMPNTPDGAYFSAGYDPHTLTAYTSPNNSKSYAVFADYYPGYPDWLGVVDLACVLTLPRNPGTHIVSGSAASCTRYVAIP